MFKFLAGVILILGALVILWLWRDGRFLTGIEGRVAAIVRDIKKEERRSGYTFINRISNQLPSPLDDIAGRLFSYNSKGEYYFEHRLTLLGTNAVPSLMRVVEFERSVMARRICSSVLAEMRAVEATPLLVRVLQTDKDPEVRSDMVAAIQTMRDTNAAPALLAAMQNDEHTEVRGASAVTLGKMQQRWALPEIIAALKKEPEVEARREMVEALGLMPDLKSVPVLIVSLQPNPKSDSKSDSFPPPDQYSSSNYEDYWHTDLRAKAALALGSIGGDKAVEALIARLAVESQDSVGEAICTSLGLLGDKRAVSALRKALDDRGQFRGHAAKALGEIGEEVVLPDLLSLLNDRDDDVRAAALAGIGFLGDTNALEAIRGRLAEDYDNDVRVAACTTLALLGGVEDGAAIVEALPRINNRADAIWALGYLATSNAIDALEASLDDSSYDEIRFAAAYGLAQVRCEGAAKAVKRHLGDKSDNVRHAKACALLMLGDDSGLSTVKKSLRSDSEWQRFGALLAVDRSGSKSLSDLIKPLLSDPESAIRLYATKALEGNATAALIALLKDDDSSFRHYAARALAFYCDPEAIPALREACHDPNRQVREAARLTLHRTLRAQRELE